MSDHETLISLEVSPLRRLLALVLIYTLGVLLIAMAALSPPRDLHWLFFLILMGVGALVLAEKIRRSPVTRLDLSKSALTDNRGRILAELENIESVDRGAFAFKPSNGFLIRLTEKTVFSYVPGVYWTYRRRIGVGGITSAPQAKNMVDLISTMLAERDR